MPRPARSPSHPKHLRAGFIRLDFFAWVGLLVVSLCAVYLFAVWFRAAGIGQRKGPPLPNATIERIDGKFMRLHQFRGDPLAIHLWSVDCERCIDEIRVFYRAALEVNPRYRQVRYLLINQGDSLDEVQDFLREHHIGRELIYLDPHQTLKRRYGFNTLPGALFFDPEGELRQIQSAVGSIQTLAADLDRIRPR